MRTVLSILFILIIFIVNAGYAEQIAITKHKTYIKQGFSKEWTTTLPADDSWLVLPQNPKARSVRIKDLNIPGLEKRAFLSLKSPKQQLFTIITSFTIIDNTSQTGLYIKAIGEQWDVYINGTKINSHIDAHRSVLLSLTGLVKKGENILAFRITGDPASNFTGLFKNNPYIIDDFNILQKKQTECLSIALIFLFLIVGLYHFYLYLIRRKEIYNLFYGLFSIAIFVDMIVQTNVVYHTIPNLHTLGKIEHIFLFAIIPPFCFFIDSLLVHKTSLFAKIYGMFTLLLIILSIPFSMNFVFDLLLIWQLSTILPFSYFLLIIIKSLIDKINSIRSENSSCIKLLFFALFQTIPGNLLIGTSIAIACGIYDIIDAHFYLNDYQLLRFGMFILTISMTLILSNKFINVFSQIETLNISLQNKIEDLNIAHSRITASEKRYKFLVEGSTDIIFSLDEDLNFLTANQAIRNILKITPQEILTKPFLDLIYDPSGVTKQVISVMITHMIKNKTPIQFKVDLKSFFGSEPKEMLVKLETVAIDEKNEILGKASNIIEDTMLKHFILEKQVFKINNYLYTAEEISFRATRNLYKYILSKKVNLVRLGLREIIINSIEHGNLNITFNEKNNAIKNDSYFELIEARQNNPAYKDRTVTIDYAIDSHEARYKITDEGDGFDYSNFLNNSKKNDGIIFANGRGIQMALSIFDEVIYNGNGNEVILIKKLK